MANSVVKVTDLRDEEINDSLMLLVGVDGTVTPDQETVETYLRQKNGSTDLQIVKLKSSEKQGIDITVDNVTYVPDIVNEEIIKMDMDEIARNVYNFRLDHDYTPLTSPKSKTTPTDDVDELARTLSILDGPATGQILSAVDLSEPPPLILASAIKPKPSSKVKLIQSITISPPSNVVNNRKPPVLTPEVPLVKIQKEIKSPTVEEKLEELIKPSKEETTEPEKIEYEPLANLVTPKSKMKVVKPVRKIQSKLTKLKLKESLKEESSDEDSFLDDQLDEITSSEDNDSDFDIEEEIKVKLAGKRINKRTKPVEPSKPIKTIKHKTRAKEKKEDIKKEIPQEKEEEKVKEKKEEPKLDTKEVEKEAEVKPPEKKPVKKEKKIPKPIPDDFALFSTPDIIRRVGGKEPTTPSTPLTPEVSPIKPAKIVPTEHRKSLENSPHSVKARHSIDSKEKEKDKDKEKVKEKHQEHKIKDSKERRPSISEIKSKRLSVDEKSKPKDVKHDRRASDARKHEKSNIRQDGTVLNLDMASVEDIRSIILNEDTKSFTMDTIINTSDGQNLESNMNLDTTGLDLDPAILDNLNNDEISEDILYQVAQSLVSNPELQNAIDKGINEGVLDPMTVDNVVSSQDVSQQNTSNDVIQGGTQIVRPDGRVIIIPPLERPTTRSRNKKTTSVTAPAEDSKPSFKPIHKPLDDEHVSGNELDSSADEEEESEDDPNKLWCICNQPHNNRFMICCDTCEEWYHGKCVNITKTMGQQMEAEGKEWICLFCKDPKLRRPQAAARRIRKASRNSRTSTESSGSTAKKTETVANAISCVVCQKPARSNSVYCSEGCILAHAQGIETVLVYERSTGKMVTGNKVPSAANLDQWLKEHPGFEAVRSGEVKEVVTAKAGNLAQTKLKLVKNTTDHGVSLAVQKKGVSVGIIKHSPKQQQLHQQVKSALKASLLGAKQSPNKTPPHIKESPKAKFVKPEVLKSPPVTPNKPKLVQTTLVKTPQTSSEKKPKPPVSVKERERSSSITGKDKTKTPRQRKDSTKDREETTPQKPQENIRENVQKTVFEQLTNRLKGVTDLKLSEEEVKSISLEIESQLYKCFGDTGQKYRNKYRSLIFNIKDVKNQTLWRRICEKNITPYELVRLSTDDMANQELAQWREKEAKHQLDMIKKSELELLNCNRQYVLKTHKGEQVVEDDTGNKVDNTEMIKSLTEGSTLDSGESNRDTSKERDKKSTKHSHRDRDRNRSKDKEYRSHRSSSRDRDKDRSRRRSRSRDRKHSDRKKRSRSKERDRHRKSSHKSSRHKRDIISTTEKLDKKSKEILEQLVDSKIVPPLEDRLWKHVPQEDIVPAIESDSDHEPSSTVTIPTPPRVADSSEEDKNLPVSPEKEKDIFDFGIRSTSPPPITRPTEIWRGVINMVDVAQISIIAHEVSGDCVGLNKELTANLDIVGRISPDTVWDYIGKMKCSNSKGISLIRLNPTNIEEKMPYLALYSYLNSRDRLGVVKCVNKAVKDFYIYPLAPQKPIPQVLLPINGPGFEESRPSLLLGIIVRDKRKRPYVEPTPVSHLPAAKKSRISTPPLPVAPPPLAPPPPPPPPPRSYTPPPVNDPRLNKKLPTPATLAPPPPPAEPITIPPPVVPISVPPPPPPLTIASSILPSVIPGLEPPTPPPIVILEEDEPYSPGDSSDSDVQIIESSSPKQPPPASTTCSATSYPEIPGLTLGFSANPIEVQRQIEELNKKIEMQKSEITSMTQNIASSEIGTSALASIALPNNLQQILDSIRTKKEAIDTVVASVEQTIQSDLTIPLMIPKTFTRPLNNTSVAPPPPFLESSSDTIPLKLPPKPLIKPTSVNSPLLDDKPSVLSSLSAEDLIKKAAEMLGETGGDKRTSERELPVAKRSRTEVNLPPVPGVNNDP
ncbi:death-inducer obliterator 1 isoform X2 [Diabrotica virgifera virgifera]|uniref:Death-inducer obliterator 1 n=1 Tax=Diabrotica virgifera virgifera TaxID=50390 RepID=A0ABM5JID5_DIAVI|nr:death-inducer obliterator 1 isoform X2 [Diabrotica virgifera virgifera]